MKRRTTAIGFILIIGIAACNDKTSEKEISAASTAANTETKQLVFDKLVGTWKSEDGKSFEQWTKKDNGTFEYRAYSVKGIDTSWNEQATIYPENSTWIFENTVKDQNDGKAVKFTSILFNETTVQFSNPQHEFPTDINYYIPDVNTVNAFIVGPNSKGGKDTIPFNYTRIK